MALINEAWRRQGVITNLNEDGFESVAPAPARTAAACPSSNSEGPPPDEASPAPAGPGTAGFPPRRELAQLAGAKQREVNQRPTTLPAGSGGPVRPMLNRQPRRARLFSIAPQRHVHQPRTV